MTLTLTDGVSSRERADCTVRAFANVTGASYERSYQLAQDAGRRGSGRFKSSVLIAEAKRSGFRFRKLRFGSRTIARFVREYPTGRFYVVKRAHAFAIVDGTVFGSRTEREVIKAAWEFLGEEQSSAAIARGAVGILNKDYSCGLFNFHPEDR